MRVSSKIADVVFVATMGVCAVATCACAALFVYDWMFRVTQRDLIERVEALEQWKETTRPCWVLREHE